SRRPDDIVDRLALRQVGGFQEEVRLRPQAKGPDPVSGGEVLGGGGALVNVPGEDDGVGRFEAERDLDLPGERVLEGTEDLRRGELRQGLEQEAPGLAGER